MNRFQLPNTNQEKTVLKTIRLKYDILKKIEQLSKDSDLSMNRILNECIAFALEHLDEEKLKK